ncbi:MAG: von Willebrand factor type A domain-containing protein, partial [Myxococcota bacterium]
DRPLSTFSIDVDTASYSNVRRFLLDGSIPPEGAVRIEELVNYFQYPSETRARKHPFLLETEVFEAPWAKSHRLVRIAVHGREIPEDEIPPRNLVFLLDVSGSMQGADRLGLVKRGLTDLIQRLRPEDRVAIVVYAGASGLLLPSTPGDQRWRILDALNALTAGGSTHGAAGIRLAYDTARAHFDAQGINRVILATDGDFNVGVTSRSELVKLIEKERQSGVFLTVLGFGRGNLNDAGMEELADKGNGHYAYIDSIAEARKVLVHEAGGTLVTIAKDVKIQVEFNPMRVAAYRLIGYENRRLEDRDFNDDKKDAGEIGAGHDVTALYEIVPVGVDFDSGVDPLKYQKLIEPNASGSDDWLTVKLRYKVPQGSKSQLVSTVVDGSPHRLEETSESGRFTAAVALFGMLLRDSDFKGEGDFDLVRSLARGALGEDPRGERAEFVRLVALAKDLRS